MSKRVQKKVKKTRKRTNSESKSASSKRVKKESVGNSLGILRKEVRNKRYNARELLYDLKFSQDLRGGVGNVLNAIGKMLQAFLKELISQMKNNDYRLVIISPELRDPL